MKNMLPLVVLCAFFFNNCLFAQDTLKVQTFTWDSETRADTFDFPDNPTEQYEKILMVYNMRCHDLEVGSGNVGCREWDYSCNTFITDPTRFDSSRASHPNFIISNFDGTDFNYRMEPTYSYTQYEQKETSYSSVNNETVSQIGIANSSLQLEGNANIRRTQFLYSAGELANSGLVAGAIDGLEMQLEFTGNPIRFFRIRMKETTAAELDAALPETEGFSEVYFKDTEFDQFTANRLNFHTPFNWDGSSGLIIELNMELPDGLNNNTNVVGAQDLGSNAGLLTGYSLPDRYLEFDGSSVVELRRSTFAKVNKEITLSFWNYGLPDALPANTSMMEGVDQDNNRQINIHLPWGNSQIYWDCGNDGSGFDRINKVADPADFAGKWNHWAFTKNTNTGEMKIFLNGQLWHSGTGNLKPIDVDRFLLGSSAVWSPVHYGRVDDFQIWNVALDEATIRDWMYRKPDDTHPLYSELEAYYSFDRITNGELNNERSNVHTATILGQTSVIAHRSSDIFKNFIPTTTRPLLSFVQGDYQKAIQTIFVLDSVINNPRRVVQFEIEGGQPVAIDTAYLWETGLADVLNEAGAIVGQINIVEEGTHSIEDLIYYNSREAKFEILSLVTPYGNGLDLGAKGKTFIFDVTDYAPILKGRKRLSIEMGGQWQEEMDIRFLYIKGTPPRDPVDIQNIWPFARGGYAAIQEDNIFEPRMVAVPANGSQFKLRAAVTGHGQNGEFVPRTHYLNLDGNNQDFQFDVWKECAYNPMFPQGGTWLFDRAGWCPGMATDVHEFDITDRVSPGSPTLIDYGVNGATLTEANYLVSAQLVTYGPANFQLDAAVTEIIRPSKRDEYARLNPSCNRPMIEIRNTGATTLTSLAIHYGVQGGNELTYNWTGKLDFLESELLELPIDNLGFWSTSSNESVFEVRVDQPNGGTDAYAANNRLESAFKTAVVYDFANLQFILRTNLHGDESRYTITNQRGEVVIDRDNLMSETEYIEELDFPAGCYSLELEDRGDDGLFYWYYDVFGPPQGYGYAYFRYLFNNIAPITLKSFEEEFGGSIRYDFIVPETVGAEDLEYPTLLSVYPNPVDDRLIIEMEGFEGSGFRLGLYDLTGRLLEQIEMEDPNGLAVRQQISMKAYPAGLYYVRLMNDKKLWVREVVKQ